jgi:hypothetical protein
MNLESGVRVTVGEDAAGPTLEMAGNGGFFVSQRTHLTGAEIRALIRQLGGVTRDDVYTAGLEIGRIITEAREAQLFIEPVVVQQIVEVMQALERQARR